ncbi:MAG: malectin domain-containing carbohydrate-binding protein, partial [Kiritimatiellae bacterium]|nr:malectin domain-containing carbohydrate-binding protein [Kiritimatiellia bacterium]
MITWKTGLELVIPGGDDFPSSYYLGTGAWKAAIPVASKTDLSHSWFGVDANGGRVSLDARPVSITVGVRTYAQTDATALGAVGTVYTLIAADSKLFAITGQGGVYCFGGTPVGSPPVHSLSVITLPNTNDSWTTAAGTMLSQSGIGSSGTGVGLVWGTGSGRLVEELLKQSALIIDAFDPNQSKCEALRRKLDDAVLYGAPGPSGVHVGSPVDLVFPPTLARLIAVEDLASSGFSSGVDFAKKLYRALRPNGGEGWLPTTQAEHDQFVTWVSQAGLQEVTVTRSGSWTVMNRTGLPGGLAAVMKPPFGTLWFGRPGTTLHDKYSGGAQKCITLAGGMNANDGTAPMGENPGSTLVNPLTGLTDIRNIFRGYGCAGDRDHGNMWVARSNLSGVYDKWRDSGTIHLFNARPTCSGTIWQYNDGTVHTYAPGCGCNFAFRASASFVPMTDEDVAEQWAWWGTESAWAMEGIEDAPVRRVGINFGAISCRREEDGALWIAYPRWAEDGPKMEVEFTPANPTRYYHHASRITGGDGPRWVAGSGVIGTESIRIGLTKKAVAEQAPGTLVVDGVLNEACWNGTSEIYMSHDENFGEHESAAAYLRYDASNLYVGLRKNGNYVGSSEAFTVYLSGRNALNQYGVIGKYLRYELKADGARIDALATSSDQNLPIEDHAWNGVWTGAVSVDATWFTAEMAIPWSEIEAQGIDRDRLLVNIWGPGLTRVESLYRVGGIIFAGSSRVPSSDRSCEHFVPLYLDSARGSIAVARPYKVRLHFAELYETAVGGRVFDVKLQGQTVLSNFDILAAAGGRNRSVVREFSVNILDKIDIGFVAKVGEPIISGVEFVNETATGSNIAPVADAEVYPASGAAPLVVAFSAMDSYDLNDAALTYAWDF